MTIGSVDATIFCWIQLLSMHKRIYNFTEALLFYLFIFFRFWIFHLATGYSLALCFRSCCVILFLCTNGWFFIFLYSMIVYICCPNIQLNVTIAFTVFIFRIHLKLVLTNWVSLITVRCSTSCHVRLIRLQLVHMSTNDTDMSRSD